MKKIIVLAAAIVLISAPIAISEGYKDTQGYKDYLKLPDGYKSPAMEEVYKKGYEAEQKIKKSPCSKGGTIQEFLDKKAMIPAVEDLGWVTAPSQKDYYVERLLLSGKQKLSYRWKVNQYGKITPLNGKAMGLTPGWFK